MGFRVLRAACNTSFNSELIFVNKLGSCPEKQEGKLKACWLRLYVKQKVISFKKEEEKASAKLHWERDQVIEK